MQKIIAWFTLIVQFLVISAGGGLRDIRGTDDESAALPAAQRCEERAVILADSYFNNCYMTVPNRLIMKVGWYDTHTSCWEYCGLLSLGVAMADIDSSYLTTCCRIADGLGYYRHLNKDGSFGGYAVKRAVVKNCAGEGVAYDDNMWLCRDLITLYEISDCEKYLDMAVEIADFLINNAYEELDADILRDYGFDVPDEIGGFYWDYRHDAMHTCSNGPAVQCLAALSRVTGDDTYLTYALRCWSFLKCLVNEDGVFYDLMALGKDENNKPVSVLGLDEHYYSYNSGSPMTAAAELYQATGDESYLSTAAYWAESADSFFASDTALGVKSYPDGNVWFNLILLNGFLALSEYIPQCEEYIGNMLSSIDYAYDNFREVRTVELGGTFLPRNWTGGFSGVWEDDYDSLAVSANAEIYAKLATHYSLLTAE